MSEIPSYKKRKKAENIAFSPELSKRLKEIRSQLGIPEGGFPKDKITIVGPPEKGFPKEQYFYPKEANKWYFEHVQKTTGKRLEDLPRPLAEYYWYFPKEIAGIDEICSRQPCRPGFYPEVPLDRYAMDLVREFGLPEDLVNEVKHHILVEEASGMGIHPKLQLIPIPMEGSDGLYFCALISGIDGSATQKDWLEIWQEVKNQMKRAGIKMAPTKRDKDNISIRDLNWWGWSQRGLSLKKIADKWQKISPNVDGYSEDTIRAAIKRIEDEMHSIS